MAIAVKIMSDAEVDALIAREGDEACAEICHCDPGPNKDCAGFGHCTYLQDRINERFRARR